MERLILSRQEVILQINILQVQSILALFCTKLLSFDIQKFAL